MFHPHIVISQPLSACLDIRVASKWRQKIEVPVSIVKEIRITLEHIKIKIQKNFRINKSSKAHRLTSKLTKKSDILQIDLSGVECIYVPHTPPQAQYMPSFLVRIFTLGPGRPFVRVSVTI